METSLPLRAMFGTGARAIRLLFHNPTCNFIRRRNFRNDAAWARTPKVYWEYCSPRVLVLEYLPGEQKEEGGKRCV